MCCIDGSLRTSPMHRGKKYNEGTDCEQFLLPGHRRHACWDEDDVPATENRSSQGAQTASPAKATSEFSTSR